MPRIRITPEHLTSITPQLKTAADSIAALDGQLINILANLDMEVRQRSDIDAQVQSARQRARALSQEAARLADLLRRTAETFTAADNQGGQALAGLFVQKLAVINGSIPVSGGGFALPAALTLAAVPLAVAGAAAAVPGIVGQVEKWVREKFGWFLPDRNLPTVTRRTGDFGALIDAIKTPGVGTKPSSGFGALIEQSQQGTSANAPEATQIKIPDVTERSDGQWWADVPVKNQADLRYKGNPTAYGCTPTSASMILDYWKAQDSTRLTATPQELLALNENQGQFSQTGMTIANLNDDLAPLGYTSAVFTGSDPSALKAAVETGPVIAVVRVGMAGSGYPHAVVVTGISSPDNQVRINDPLTGRSQTYTWEQFERSWGSDFGKTKDGTPYATHSFATILPN